MVAPLKAHGPHSSRLDSSAPLVLIDVLTEQGVAGHSYIFAYTVAALVPLARLVDEIGAELKGKSIAPVVRMREFDRRFRLVGWQGNSSGLDMAFGDAIARTLDVPIVTLLGGAPIALPAYDSYGMIDPKADGKTILGSSKAAFGQSKSSSAKACRSGREDCSSDTFDDRSGNQTDGRLQSIA